MARNIHEDIKEIMEDAGAYAISESANIIPNIKDLSKEQLEMLNVLLQYSWNRGYKASIKDQEERN